MSTTVNPETLTHHLPTRSRRGAALSRAKSALSDALDSRLNLEIISQEQRKIELLGEILGLSPSESLSRLAGADLGEIEGWIGKVEQTKGREG